MSGSEEQQMVVDLALSQDLSTLPCAYGRNSERVKQLFQSYCPAGYYVLSVFPLRTNRKPFCRWNVVYVYTDTRRNLAEDAKAVWKPLQWYLPINGYVLTKMRCEGSEDFSESWQITYGARCLCKKDFRKPLTQLCTDMLNLNQLILIKTEIKSELN